MFLLIDNDILGTINLVNNNVEDIARFVTVVVDFFITMKTTYISLLIKIHLLNSMNTHKHRIQEKL